MTLALDRRSFLAMAAAGAASLAAVPRALARGTAGLAGPGAAPAGWAGYDRSVVIDALSGLGITSRPRDAALTAAELSEAKASGVTAVNLTVSAVGVLQGAFPQTVDQIGFWDREVNKHPDALVKVRSAADIRAAKSSGRFGLIYGFQDTLMLGDELGRLDTFYELGVRIIQLTYNGRNLVGDGCLEPGNAGLSRFGKRLVERMNEIGVLVDLSHCGRRTTTEGIEVSKKPVAITHAGCAAVADLPRNKTDEQLRLLADKGGVFGVYLMPFLRTKGQPMAEDVIRHIDHAVNLCGEDHVGIGTDGSVSPVALTPEYIAQFKEEIAQRRKLGISAPGESEDVYTFVPDLNSARRLDTLAAMLIGRGYSPERVAKILGGNFARLFAEAWA
ncbi:MAG TPA: membrane dipeptidase [Thermoanaerobaculia bacterium]|nr:membrane dipeptidase [Thermoanaerobaculia bacterium]